MEYHTSFIEGVLIGALIGGFIVNLIHAIDYIWRKEVTDGEN